MSYILDALRRAEADRERERGQVPGLHTPSAESARAATSPRRSLPWLGGGLLLLAGMGAGIWWASESREVPPAAAPLAAPVPEPAPRTPPAPAALAPVPQPVASAPSYLPPVPPPAPVAATPAPLPAAVPAPARADEARIPRLAELPDSTRRELPALAISGSVYSDDPASRFVMINGEAVREGARLGAELVLEKIGPRELVLRFKGQRYRQPI